jgi:recombination protein RecR
MKLPKVVDDLVSSFERLPGVGHKSAQRLAFYLLRVPQRDLDLFATSVAELKRKTRFCSLCHNLTESEECSVCADISRDHTQVCVVESFQDVLAIEKAGSYSGVYHVLHGCLSPLNNVGPEELYIDTLISRVKSGKVEELILATNTSLEGEATAMYLTQSVAKVNTAVKVTRIGRGLPTGIELEFADDETLKNALASRIGYN